jgi:hypothetical protein
MLTHTTLTKYTSQNGWIEMSHVLNAINTVEAKIKTTDADKLRKARWKSWRNRQKTLDDIRKDRAEYGSGDVKSGSDKVNPKRIK